MISGNIVSLNDIEEIQEAVQNVKPGMIEAYLKTLPEKAFALSIRVLLTLLFLAVGILLIRWARKIIRKTMEKSGAEKGAVQFVDSCLKIVLYVILFLTVAVRYGFDASSIVAIIGSIGLAFGLALQGALSNFAGGVLILVLKPFVVGDYIVEDTNKNEGYVTEIQIFYTRLHTIDNRVIVIPNGTLANQSLTNVTKMKDRQLEIKVGISYHADLKKAKEILVKLLKEDKDVNSKSNPLVFVDSLGESAVILGIRVWVKTEEYFNTKWRLTENIKLTFDQKGIDIPFSQMDVHILQ